MGDVTKLWTDIAQYVLDIEKKGKKKLPLWIEQRT
jgi:hypothetical protein